MGGGMPLAAFISSKEIMSSLSHDPILGHITTFGGHPVNCAAGIATLETLLTLDLQTEIESKSLEFLKRLKHPLIKEVRNVGLMFAIDLGDNNLVQKVIQNCLQNGLITDWFLFNDQSLRICPPFIISMKEIKQACTIILNALD